MNLTLLFDLDNTLLNSSMDTFIPAYFQAFSDFFQDRVEPELILPALLSGTRKMMANTDPSRTLKQVFDAEFFPKIGLAREEMQPRLDRFYEEAFPALSYLTSPRPEAVELVRWAFTQGARLAIATNPLFPLAAIHQRMRWAGLPPEEYPFAVISTYETFHFAKPKPAYFAEVLGRMGWPEGPVLMVGDDVENDLPGSHTLGVPAYWVNTPDAILPPGIPLAGQGSIGDLRPWLESTDLSALEPAFSTPEAL
jgi:FMN phosphatase YigB (HAD superfamily)